MKRNDRILFNHLYDLAVETIKSKDELVQQYQKFIKVLEKEKKR